MRQMWKVLLFMAVGACSSVLLANGQDSQSLGDVARRARQEKQNKEAQGKKGQAEARSKVITNEDISSHSESASEVSAPGAKAHGPSDSAPSSSGGAKIPAEQWKSQIKAQKAAVATLTDKIDRLNGSVQLAPPNCVYGCVQWNEHQKQKQVEVEQMRSQLESEKKRLQDMQESARQQGYGSSVYDP